MDGTGETRVVTRGLLDSPWGLAIAPASFGDLAGDLLVGNFGNGRINAYSIDNHGHGHFEDQLKDPSGKPIQIDGLWALKVGNDHAAGSSNTLFFTAGINGEADGLFGSLQAVPKPHDDNGDDNDQADDRSDLGRDIAASLKSSSGVFSAISSSAANPLANVFISPADVQTFTPGHSGSEMGLLHSTA